MEGRYLLGVSDPAETLAYLRRFADGAEPDAGALARQASAAAARRRGRPAELLQEPVQPAPREWRDHLEQVAARPIFQRLYGARPWEFVAAPLGALLTVQPHLHFSHAASCLPPAAGAPEMLSLCLPSEPEPLELWGGVSEGEPPSASFYTRDPNVQITGARMELQPQLSVTFTISKAALFAHVVAVGGRLYLKNGTHRAVALALRGARYLPCVLQKSEDGDDLPRLLPRQTLFGAHPPRLLEFLDAACYVAHPWVDRVKFIRLVPEEFFAPLPVADRP